MVWEMIVGPVLDKPNARCPEPEKQEEVLNHQLTVWIYNFGKSTEQKLKSLAVYVITENVEMKKKLYKLKKKDKNKNITVQ